MKNLTEKQKDIFSFIEYFMNTNDMAPTVYEIAEHFKVKTSTVFSHLKALQTKGFINRSSKARSIALSKVRRKHHVQLSSGVAIPVVELSDMENVPGNTKKKTKEELFYDKKQLGEKNCSDLFAVHVRGTSMQNLGIFDGDIVILKPCADKIDRGAIVLANLGGRSVLRLCYPIDAEHIELRPGSPEYRTLTCKKSDTSLKGVAIGLQRSL